jgi:hypothetical protein
MNRSDVVRRLVLAWVTAIAAAGSSFAFAAERDCEAGPYPNEDVEREATRILGPDFASASTFRLAVVAPKPLEIEVEIRLKPGSRACLEARGHSNEGSVLIQAPVVAVFTMSAEGKSERVEIEAAGVTVGWERATRPHERYLLLGELAFALGPRTESAAQQTATTLQGDRRFAGWKALLVGALQGKREARSSSIEVLARLGISGVPGDSWVRLRELQDQGALSSGELRRLGWLTRRGRDPATGDTATFACSAGSPAPRLFVAGTQMSGWKRVGDMHELQVPAVGLVPVRVEFPDDITGQAFVTVLSGGVRIVVSPVWGPTTGALPPGQLCGVMKVRSPDTGCNHGGDPVPVGRVFDLSSCGGPAASGSEIDFGVPLVPTVPGLYVHDRPGNVVFEPAYAGRPGRPPVRCRPL